MPLVIPEKRNSNSLPDDIFSYNQDKFYEFVEHWYGNDLAQLFSFQAIRNGSHLLNTTTDDILSVLQHESEDINKLKNLCCFELANKRFEVRLGVKLAINNLIQLLSIKQEQEKKKKRSSGQHSSSSIDTSTSIDQTQSQNETKLLSATSLTSSSTDTNPTRSRLPLVQNKMNEMDHILDIKNRISKWWDGVDNNNNSLLDEGTQYFLEINKSINNSYTCVLSCQCGIRFKLPCTEGLFKLSAFYRHLKEKKCTNVTENDSTNKENQLSCTSKSSSVKSKKKKTSTSTTSKRPRSPSTQVSASSGKMN
ncbi:unnamed protein product, partial [Rotaria sp. Silwood1]